MVLVDDHNDTVRREFTRQATTFTPAGWASTGVDWIVDQVGPTVEEQVWRWPLAPHISGWRWPAGRRT